MTRIKTKTVDAGQSPEQLGLGSDELPKSSA